MSTTVDLGKITASVDVGTTTTGAAGTNASVTNVGTTQDAVLNFTIPRGAQGVQGPQGSTGPQGPAGPTGPQGPMGDVAVITPEQQAAFTMYSVPGQNTDGPMTQKAVTDAVGNLTELCLNNPMCTYDSVGTNTGTYTNRRIDVKKGRIRIKMNGSISRASGITDLQSYLKITLYDTAGVEQKRIFEVSTLEITSTAEYYTFTPTLTSFDINTNVDNDGYIIIGERISTASTYSIGVYVNDDNENLANVGFWNIIGGNESGYATSEGIPVKAGEKLHISLKGETSKSSALTDSQVFLRVQFVDSNDTEYDLYTLSTVSSTSGMAIFDSAKKLTYRDFDYTPSVDGKIRIKHRMSTGSHLQANVLMSAEVVNDNRVNKTLIINKDVVLRKGDTDTRGLINLGCIHGGFKWDINLNNPNYRYVFRVYRDDPGYYYPYDRVFDSGWLSGHTVGSAYGEYLLYPLLTIGRTDDAVLTATDLANIQSALSGSITYNNLSHLAKEPQKKNIISNRHLQVCAHRGFHLNDVPENSIDSVRFAAELGFDMVETDFSQTSDGELVLMHDASINRTMVNADGTAISGTVNIINKTLAQLRTNYVLKSEDARMMKPIPTLEEYFLACKKFGIYPCPEIKTSGNNNASVLKAYNLGIEIMGKDNFAFISFDYSLLDYARTLSPNLLLGYIGNSILGTTNSITGDSRETPYTMWSPKYDNTHGVSAELIKQYHEKGMKVQVWTPPVAEYPYINELGADIVTTDDIGSNIGNTIGYVFDSYATWNDFITDGVFDGQTLTLDTSQQLSCNLKETIVNGKFTLEINFTGSLTITAPNLSTTVTSSDADKTYIYQGVIDYKNPSLSITATAASVIKMIRYYVVPVNQ